MELINIPEIARIRINELVEQVAEKDAIIKTLQKERNEYKQCYEKSLLYIEEVRQ